MHRSGPDAQRVLLADGIAERTGRGLDLDVMTDLGPALQAVAAATEAWRLWRYEAVVVLMQESQVQAASHWWSGRIARMAQRVLPELAAASRVLLVRLREDSSVVDPSASSWQDGAAGPAVSSLAVPLAAIDGSGRRQDGTAAIADRVAVLLRDAEAGAGHGGTARERRAQPEPEADRQRAVDRASEALGGLTPDLERVVLLARNTFSVPFAQVNLLDRGRIRTLAFVGATGDGAEEPICTIAVRGSGPTVIADTWQDHRFDANPHVHGPHPVRFYAAHPIESVDGYRIGTLCVFDLVPHDEGDVDPAVLRDLALLAEAEISVLP
jgi:GAF domain-containing protein